MIVGVCGFGWTGSGAVKDFLSEYDEINNLAGIGCDYEFSFVYKTDGILDLRYHLFEGTCREMACNDAIKRFWDTVCESCGPRSRIQKLTNGQFYTLSKEYLDSITQIKWDYFRLRDYTNGGRLKQLEGRIRYKLQREFDKRLSRFVSFFPKTTCYYSSCPEDFDEKSKQYISRIINAISGHDSRIVLLDQPFAADFPERSFPYFENPYAIVVDRDPRDLFIMMKKICFSQGHLLDDVNDYIAFYRGVRKNSSASKINQRVLRIRFEDLVYGYDIVKKRIEDFLCISKHTKQYHFFDPKVSINNTRLFLRYPEEKHNIEVIESELSDYLYCFPTRSIDVNNKPF